MAGGPPIRAGHFAAQPRYHPPSASHGRAVSPGCDSLRRSTAPKAVGSGTPARSGFPTTLAVFDNEPVRCREAALCPSPLWRAGFHRALAGVRFTCDAYFESPDGFAFSIRFSRSVNSGWRSVHVQFKAKEGINAKLRTDRSSSKYFTYIGGYFIIQTRVMAITRLNGTRFRLRPMRKASSTRNTRQTRRTTFHQRIASTTPATASAPPIHSEPWENISIPKGTTKSPAKKSTFAKNEDVEEIRCISDGTQNAPFLLSLPRHRPRPAMS
jgi:hypothetical protein